MGGLAEGGRCCWAEGQESGAGLVNAVEGWIFVASVAACSSNVEVVGTGGAGAWGVGGWVYSTALMQTRWRAEVGEGLVAELSLYLFLSHYSAVILTATRKGYLKSQKRRAA